MPQPGRPVENIVQVRVVPVEHGGELHVVERGRGPAIVLIPGWTMNWTVFEHQVELLSRSWRVIAFDPRGHGRTPATFEGNRYCQQGRDLALVVDELGVERFALVGWSFGAYAGYEYIQEAGTDRLTHFVSIDQPPCARADDETAWADFTWPSFAAFIDAVCERRDEFWEEFVSWLVSQTLEPDDGEWLRRMHMTTPAPVAMLLALDGMLRDYTTLVEQQLDGHVPVLHAVSEESYARAEAWLAEHSPSAQVVTIPSHMGFWEAPRQFNSSLADFLGR